MKKIAILVPDLSLGGGQRVAVNTAQLLAYKYKVTLVIFTDEKQLFDAHTQLINLNCSTKNNIFGKIYTVYKRVKQYKKLLKKEKFDLTISFLESANLCAFLSDRKKSILTIHTKPELLTPFDQFILQYIFYFSHTLIAVSKGLKDTLESTLKLNNISVINNYIDIPQIQSLASRKSFKHPRKFMVSVGRLVEVKRYDIMIDAFCKSKASKEHDLIIIGDGEKFSDLKDHINSYPPPYANKIHLLGEMKNPFPIISAAELFLMTSRIEAFPMVLLEALALNKPIISYDCPAGLADIVLHNKNGLLVDNDDFENLVSSIDRVIYDKYFKSKLISNTLQSVNRFSAKEIAHDWEKYIETMTD